MNAPSSERFKLEDLKIAAPCRVAWETLEGSDRVRFCGQCRKNVYDLSSMSRAEADALLAGTGVDLPCVRLFRRQDGTVLTADCPVGLARRAARRLRRISFAVAGLLGLGAIGAALFGGPLRAWAASSCRPSQGSGLAPPTLPPVVGVPVQVKPPPSSP